MANFVDELKNASLKKHVVTSIEYECKDSGKEEEVFEMVQDVITNHLDEFAKITYDLVPGNKVKVEVIENK